jgi:hypothetical protein
MDVVREALNILKLVLQARAPYDTGNLAINSIRIVGNAVYIGGEIADYAIYTNEPWLSSKWHGAKNPNEGWVQAAIHEAVPVIQMALNGKATIEDIENAKQYYADAIEERKRELIEKLKELRDAII